MLFLFKQLQKRFNLQYLGIRDVAINIIGPADQGLESPSPSSQSNNNSGAQATGDKAEPIANKMNEVTLPDPVSVSSQKNPDKVDDENCNGSSPVKTATIPSGSVEKGEVEKWKNNYKELQERSREIASGLQKEVQAKEATIAMRDKWMKEMVENVKEKDAKIKELEERLAGNLTAEDSGVTIKKEAGAEEQEVVRLRKENCNLNKELRGLKVGNPSM